jgi:hypothetical protein
MEVKEETKWLCEHAKSLEKFSGQWVVFSPEEGLVGSGGSLIKVLKNARRLPNQKKPFVLHVPSKQELNTPFAVPKKS